MANDNVTKISQLLDEKLAATEERLNKKLNER